MGWGPTGQSEPTAWQSMEFAAVDFVRSLGHDVDLTTSGADGGLDLVGPEIAGQVKAHAKPVGGPDVQRLKGAAHGHRHALFFSGSGYTPKASAFAESAEVALFTISGTGHIDPTNSWGEKFCALAPTPRPPRQRQVRPASSQSSRPALRKAAWLFGWFMLLAMGGPITFTIAVEARRRSGDKPMSGPGPTSPGRWRFWAMIAGGIGACAWLRGLFGGVIWIVTFNSVSPETSENIAAALGILVGVPLLIALGRYLWTNPHDDIKVPNRLLAPATPSPPGPSTGEATS